jgi:VWFA-related protein
MKSLWKTVLLVAILMLSVEVPPPGAQSAQTQTPQTSSASNSGQDQPPALPLSDAQAKIRVNSNLVILPVTVKDGSGRLVPDLQQGDFRVFEDDVEQKINVFTVEAFPISMVILLDNDLKSKDADQVTASLRAMIGAMSTSDEAFICRFDEFFHPGKGFTNDQDKILTELKRTELDSEPYVGPSSSAMSEGPSINGHAVNGQPTVPSATIIKGQPTKALDDAVYAAARLLHDRPRGRRRIIVLISDGVNAPKFNKMNYDSTVQTLLTEGVTVYCVAVGSSYFNRKFSRLVSYAHDSGGEVYFAAKSSAMEQLYSRITEEARNQYTLAYIPQGTNRNVEYHSVEVRVRRPDLTIVTRQGYYTGAVPISSPKK